MSRGKISAAMLRDVPPSPPTGEDANEESLFTPALVSYAQGGVVYAMHPTTGAALWKRNFSNPIAAAWSVGRAGMVQELDLVDDLLVFCGQPSALEYQCQGLAVKIQHRHLLQLMEVSEALPASVKEKQRVFVGSHTADGGAGGESALFAIADPDVRIVQQQRTDPAATPTTAVSVPQQPGGTGGVVAMGLRGGLIGQDGRWVRDLVTSHRLSTQKGNKSNTKLKLRHLLRERGMTSGRVKTKWGSTALQSASSSELMEAAKKLVVSQSTHPLVATAIMRYLGNRGVLNVTMDDHHNALAITQTINANFGYWSDPADKALVPAGYGSKGYGTTAAAAGGGREEPTPSLIEKSFFDETRLARLLHRGSSCAVGSQRWPECMHGLHLIDPPGEGATKPSTAVSSGVSTAVQVGGSGGDRGRDEVWRDGTSGAAARQNSRPALLLDHTKASEPVVAPPLPGPAPSWMGWSGEVFLRSHYTVLFSLGIGLAGIYWAIFGRKRKKKKRARGGAARRGSVEGLVEDEPQNGNEVGSEKELVGPAPADAEDEAAQDGAAEVAECVVCHDADADHLLYPCGHKCVCGDCGGMLRGQHPCPICRARIRDVIRVFAVH